MSIAVMKQALEALNVATTPLAKDRQEVLRAQAALRQAIEQAEQDQPVAWMFQSGGVLKFKWHHFDRPTGEEALKYWKPLYAVQPKRKPLEPIQPCGFTSAEYGFFKLGWHKCQAAHGIGGGK